MCNGFNLFMVTMCNNFLLVFCTFSSTFAEYDLRIVVAEKKRDLLFVGKTIYVSLFLCLCSVLTLIWPVFSKYLNTAMFFK